MIAQCRAADAGFFKVADVSLNYRHALPNKIFECVLAGISILAVAIPEVVRLVEELKIGHVFEINSLTNLVTALRRMACDRSHYEQLRASVEKAREDFLAHPEWDKLVEIYAGFA
jgi:hypothetical protein